jgi:CHAD domain-containing protein
MMPKIEPRRSVARALRKTIAKELRRARRRLESAGSLGERVHESRRELKKARAALRLVRGSLARRLFEREDSLLREAGRGLSRLRDAQVLLDAARSLDLGRAVALRRLLNAELRRAKAGAPASVKSAVRALARARKDAKSLELGASGWRAVEDGLRGTYRDGRRAMKAAFAGARPEDLHEWRKEAKYLRYELQLLSSAWERPLTAYVDELHALSDRLGEYHDLGMLQEKDAEGSLADEIYERRSALAEQALSLGARLFAEKPKAFARRLRGCWKAARDKKVARSR